MANWTAKYWDGSNQPDWLEENEDKLTSWYEYVMPFSKVADKEKEKQLDDDFQDTEL
jgi:hypothetical protein